MINKAEVQNTLHTLRDYLRWAVTMFNQTDLVYGHGTDNAWDEAVNLILASLHLSPDTDQTVLDAKLLPEEKSMLMNRVIERVEKRIPVPYLVNEAWFAGLKFYVDERVIIPRSPIAELIEEEFNPWVDEANVESILDLCTGSGCIAIAAAVNFPEAMVDAVDFSQDALEVAKINVANFGLEDKVRLVYSDLFEGLKSKRYDIIVSNPPYVSETEYPTLPKEYTYEPQQALLCGDDGLDIVRRILIQAEQYLTENGILVVEVGDSQDALVALFPKVPFTWLQFEGGGEGVFLLTRQELIDAKPYLNPN